MLLSASGLDIRYDDDRQVRKLAWDTGVSRTLEYGPTGERAAMRETGDGLGSFVAYARPHFDRVEAAGNVVQAFRFTDVEGRTILEERVEEQVMPDGTRRELSVEFQHLVRDYHGSVAAILPSGGQVTRRAYESFGAPNGEAQTGLGYTGHRHLEVEGSPLGLIDMGGRMVDPVSGSFTRADHV